MCKDILLYFFIEISVSKYKEFFNVYFFEMRENSLPLSFSLSLSLSSPLSKSIVRLNLDLD